MTNINFELYKVFYHVAANLSFSVAAEKLFISQSAVSQAIRQLESQLRCRLFSRTTKQVQLTREGQLLFEYVEQAFNFIKTGERSLVQIHSLLQGEIRIGASDTICKHFLLPYLKEYNRLYPQIRINVINRTSPQCIELLRKGQVDVSIVNIPSAVKFHNLSVRPLSLIHDVFIAGNNFAHLKQSTLSAADLQAYPLMVLEKDTVSRDYFDAYFARHGLKITPEFELSSIDLLVELAKIGLGIAFVSKEYISRELAAGDVLVLPVQDPLPPRYIGVLTHNNIGLPVAAQKFIELLPQTIETIN